MIALIPARGGSKGLPGKNIKDLKGRPLIAYTIAAALSAEAVSRVIVTTDSEEIAAAARKYGAEVPFIRPPELSGDTAMAMDAYLHALDYLKQKEGLEPGKFMVLLPTAPLRDAKDIDRAAALFKAAGADTLVSVQEADTPLSWYFLQKADGMMENAGLGRAAAVDNRQANETYLIPNGAIYILDYHLLQTKRTYYTKKTLPYIMPRERSLDIDDELDFRIAGMLIESQSGSDR